MEKDILENCVLVQKERKNERKRRTSKLITTIIQFGYALCNCAIYKYYMKRIHGIRGRVQQGVLEIRRWINRAAIAKVKRSARFVVRKVGPRLHEPPFSIGDAITEDFRSIDREK